MYKFKFNDGVEIKTDNLQLNNQQSEALRKMGDFFNNKDKRSFSLLGHAGTGKTTVLRYFVRYLEKVNPCVSVVYSAPTHRACFVLKSSVRRDTRTLHTALGLTPNMNLDFFDADNIKFNRGITKSKIS